MEPLALDPGPTGCKGLRSSLARASDRWSMTVIVTLEAGPMRFNELRRRTGAAQKMLTATVRGLERDGYVTRTHTPGKMPEVHYNLTPLGRDIVQPVRELAAFMVSRLGAIEEARQEFDIRAEQGD